ncbi:MAG: acetyl-CoA C-acyltransferase FadI [Gemmatimonadetes bacterium]|nr:acetyl-CoA C-acyltransferase FadI [Gemmatimonadota bacterium]MYC90904.1 acetyl-CoA C-acyltransferase FadI [Gemmatimonadota bacterium]MYG34524.1 acetyl-CoA C-acyltransferase FadI [Gemmatimonadota bacterium]MYJ18112.1 acetyl-CoA C-acyltransferase FadI [Gemmatimonadota bacterium]
MNTAIIAGCRTPFVRSGTHFRNLTAIDLGRHAVTELVARTGISPETVEHLVYGTVLHDPQAPNIAREVGLPTLPKDVPAVTVSRACASANQAIADGANLIEAGCADVVVAGGAECLSRIPILASDRLSKTLVSASRAKTLGARLRAFARLRPRDLLPVAPAIAEYSTGESMGQAAERMARENGISREDQDLWALRSHRKAHAGTGDGRLTDEIAPFHVPPRYDVTVDRDNGIRADTSIEALSALRPVFDREYGSVTAGNASPLTDGASAVLLASPRRASELGLEPLGYLRSYAITALDPAGQLLQGPAYAAPIALDRAGLTMADIDLLEMHEAFAAQVLSNLQAWDSDDFCRKELGRPGKVGHPDPDVINVMGGSIAIGHPFGATGGRLTTTLLNELRRRDGQFGLVTVCAAGGMGFAMVLERG